MRARPSWPVLALSFALLAPHSARPDEGSLLGFKASNAAAERDLEKRFDSDLDKKLLRDWMERLTAHPHHVGSPWDKSNAEWIAEQFKEWGFDTRIEEFDVLFPTPKKRVLEMVAPTTYKATLKEPALPEDRTSSQAAEQLPTYNAYSIDGDVTGELVYVNEGIPRDYEKLATYGIDVKGKIVLARYGGSWRGIKPKVAAEHGAIGCIIYSDPAGDGYLEGDVYPKGGWRSSQSVQRGSVMDIPQYTGDPLTPGVAATKDAKRLDIKSAPTLTKIPVLPISYGDAQPLLAALQGPMAPHSWRGSLPIPYRLGPGPAKVHLALEFDWSLKTLHDVIGVVKGTERPDEWVIRGNHHDAWVNGATDPISGLVGEMAEARSIGALVKGGFHPKRTLVYAAWDGEEPGLLGSTEWVEMHQAELTRKAAVYINSDSNLRGTLALDGSHSLESFAVEAARDVQDPERDVSVAERARASIIVDGDPDDSKEAKANKDLRIGPLGSGSDYTPFLQHAGVASLNFGFGGEDQYGQYHSIYDSFDHYVRFGDPEFTYGVVLAKVGGRLVLRLLNADRLPYAFTPAAERIASYVDDLKKLADRTRTETDEQNEALLGRWALLASDPKEPYVAPAPKDKVPHLNFAPLENSSERLVRAAQSFDKALSAAETEKGGLKEDVAKSLDEKLLGFERTLTNPSGLPGRPWYVHEIYAPGRYTGYGPKTIAAVREPIELRAWTEADEQIAVVASTLDGAAKALDGARALLESHPGQ